MEVPNVNSYSDRERTFGRSQTTYGTYDDGGEGGGSDQGFGLERCSRTMTKFAGGDSEDIVFQGREQLTRECSGQEMIDHSTRLRRSRLQAQ